MAEQALNFAFGNDPTALIDSGANGWGETLSGSDYGVRWAL